MRLDVAFLPSQPFEPASSVCIVVDVLRASSTIVTLIEHGCVAILPAGTIDEARSLSAQYPGYLLCGERGGVPLEGFDYGNSPAEFARLDLSGKSVILATSNGTRMLAALVPHAPVILVGALLNRTAVARAAINIAAQRDLDITIVCAAEQGGNAFALEDALGAGAIAAAIVSAEPATELTDSAGLAHDAFIAKASDVSAAVESAQHARELIEGGFGEDVTYCVRSDVFAVVPITRYDDATLSIGRAPR